MPTTSRQLDVGALEGWLRDRLGPGRVTDLARLAGGTQNQLVRFSYGDRHLVLRMPPPEKRASSDEAMRREARVLRALSGTDVPHPAFVTAEPTLDPLGAAFLVMEHIDGVPATGDLTHGYGRDRKWRRAIGISIADASARLSRLDPRELDLEDLARPGSFLARQAGRWIAQLESYNSTANYEPLDPESAMRVSAWLDTNRPPDQAPGLVHGDFHAGNILLSTTSPGVAAIVDWELATVGDPLVDLGELLVTWPDSAGDTVLPGVTTIHPADGLVGEAEIVAAYQASSQRDLSALAWYKVLAAFRLAAIIEGTWARAVAGLADVATGRALHTGAQNLLQRAEREIARA